MATTMIDLANAARTLATTPGAAPQIQLQIAKAAPSVAEAVFASVSLTRRLAEDTERSLAKLLEQLQREKESLEEKIKAMATATERLKRQAEKLAQLAAKIAELGPAMNDAVGADPNCRPNRAVVSARVAELLALVAIAESTAAGLEDAKYRAFLDWFRRLLEQIPVLFAIPGWR